MHEPRNLDIALPLLRRFPQEMLREYANKIFRALAGEVELRGDPDRHPAPNQMRPRAQPNGPQNKNALGNRFLSFRFKKSEGAKRVVSQGHFLRL